MGTLFSAPSSMYRSSSSIVAAAEVLGRPTMVGFAEDDGPVFASVDGGDSSRIESNSDSDDIWSAERWWRCN